jgi:DNA-directed RNA polymerase specialized sigma24 family protein
MTKATRKALLPSLIASALVSPVVAEAPLHNHQPSTEQTPSQSRPASCPDCRSDRITAPDTVRDLFEDGEAIQATRKAVRSILRTSTEDAEEASQEAALRAVAKDLKTCCPHCLRRWMFRTAKNYLLDRYRKKSEVPLSNLSKFKSTDLSPADLSTNNEVGPLQILALRDEVETALIRHDLTTLSADKKVQLGRAIGDRLQSDRQFRTYLPKAAILTDHALEAIDEITPTS